MTALKRKPDAGDPRDRLPNASQPSDSTPRISGASGGRECASIGSVKPVPFTDERSFNAAKLEWRALVNLDDDLTGTGQRVAHYLMEVASPHHGIFPSQLRIARELAVSERAVGKAIAKLEERGWIKSFRNGGMTSNNYKMTTAVVLAGILRGRRDLARIEVKERRQKRLSGLSDRNACSGVIGTPVPVMIGTGVPVMIGTGVPPNPLSISLGAEPFEVIPEERGNREEGEPRSYSALLPDNDEEEAA